MITTAEVWLDNWQLGVLQHTPSGRIGFRPARTWAESADAPVLGQRFIDEPMGDYFGGRTGALPCFFANLLPQGINRDLLAELHDARDDLTLLVKLGADLLGNVVVQSSQSAIHLDDPGPSASVGLDSRLRLTASLTGMQPKFSMSHTNHGFTLPAVGQDGDWIVKLPGRLPRTPEIEYATMRWAAAAGLTVPETMLVSLTEVHGVPKPRSTLGSTCAYACRRYDRPTFGRRIHQEDFAQILDLCPNELHARRGRHRGHAAQGRIIHAICPQDLHAWLRWLVFNILCGNSDAHHKNLAIVYADARTPRLAPAYDLLAQIVYPQFDPELELHVCHVRRFQDLDIEHLLELVRKIGEPIAESEIRRMIEATRQAWSDLNTSLPLEPEEREVIEAHLRKVPLARRLPGTPLRR